MVPLKDVEKLPEFSGLLLLQQHNGKTCSMLFVSTEGGEHTGANELLTDFNEFYMNFLVICS